MENCLQFLGVCKGGMQSFMKSKALFAVGTPENHLQQWLLTWVGSNPQGSMEPFQVFDGDHLKHD